MTLAVAGVTVTVPTGSAITVTVDVPLFPSLVAVIVAVPPDAPVTTPVLETVATAVLLELHVTTRSVTTVPFTSLTVATSVVVSPSLTLTVAGATVTLPTGIAATVTADVPDFPSLVAVIVTEPTATPVTTPVADTVASAVLLDAHVTVRPVSTAPFASFTVAVKFVVWPTMTDVAAGETVTLPTGAGATVTEAVPVFPSLVAVIVVRPRPVPVTTPELLTVAT